MTDAAEAISVLHVDDEPGYAEMVGDYLVRTDDRIEVETATSAEDGLERLETGDYDCVVSDYDMPGRDGIEFLGAVRERDEDLPFVLYTGKGSEEVASEAISAGVSDYLQKGTGSGHYQLLATKIASIVEQHRTERTIERTRRRFRALVEETRDAILIVDPDGTVTYVTPSVERILGRPVEDLVGSNGFDPVHPEDRERVVTAFASLVEDPEERRSAEFRYRRPDGSWMWAEARGRDLRDVPAIDGIVVYVRDTTARKERELELERIRDFFTEAERLGNLGAWEFRESGEAEWTAGTRRIHEVPEDYEPTLQSGLDFVHPEDRSTVERAIERAIDDGEGYDLEARIVTAGGDERWVRTRGHVVENGDDRTVRGYIQDVTERVQRERELERANSQLEAAVEAGAVGTWEWSVSPDTLVVGPVFARKFGVDPAEARAGVSLDRFTAAMHEDDRDRVQAKIREALESCGEYEAEYRVWDADGELRWVSARGTVECDEDGEPVSFPGALTDVTERKRYEQRLERQNERLEAFANVVSHDLRNPLNVAQGQVQLARDEVDSERLDSIERAHDRMLTLVDDLLALARQGDAEATTAPVDLGALVDDCWGHVETWDARLVADVEATILADENRLRQLLENLFRNAVEHSSRDPHGTGGDSGDPVTVRIGALESGFYVEDDGPGIPAEDHERVFETGYSTSDEGTGFGLSIVKQVADAHGWEVRVGESEAGGARFEFSGVRRREPQ